MTQAKQKEPLSHHLPTAIRQAVEDLKECRNDKFYVLNMIDWHRPVSNGDVTIHCSVCLAGATMAKRAMLAPTENAFPCDCDEDDEYILNSLDSIRRGDITEACEESGFIPRPEITEDRSLYCEDGFSVVGQFKLDTPNDEHFEKECQRLLELADKLESYEVKS